LNHSFAKLNGGIEKSEKKGQGKTFIFFEFDFISSLFYDFSIFQKFDIRMN